MFPATTDNDNEKQPTKRKIAYTYVAETVTDNIEISTANLGSLRLRKSSNKCRPVIAIATDNQK